MKRLLLPAALLFSAGTLHAQDNTVLQFQKAHPEVICIEASDLDGFDPFFLEAYSQFILVFEKELRPADVENFEMRQKASVDVQDPVLLDQAQEIKDWLGTNQDVKIVPQSAAATLTKEQRRDLRESGALFLIGEELTVEDIRNYPH